MSDCVKTIIVLAWSCYAAGHLLRCLPAYQTCLQWALVRGLALCWMWTVGLHQMVFFLDCLHSAIAWTATCFCNMTQMCSCAHARRVANMLANSKTQLSRDAARLSARPKITSPNPAMQRPVHSHTCVSWMCMLSCLFIPVLTIATQQLNPNSVLRKGRLQPALSILRCCLCTRFHRSTMPFRQPHTNKSTKLLAHGCMHNLRGCSRTKFTCMVTNPVTKPRD